MWSLSSFILLYAKSKHSYPTQVHWEICIPITLQCVLFCSQPSSDIPVLWDDRFRRSFAFCYLLSRVIWVWRAFGYPIFFAVYSFLRIGNITEVEIDKIGTSANGDHSLHLTQVNCQLFQIGSIQFYFEHLNLAVLWINGGLLMIIFLRWCMGGRKGKVVKLTLST